jgi:hypothetical protein
MFSHTPRGKFTSRWRQLVKLIHAHNYSNPYVSASTKPTMDSIENSRIKDTGSVCLKFWMWPQYLDSVANIPISYSGLRDAVLI